MKTDFCNSLISIEDLSKLDWLKYRQTGIGGSDISSVCGVNPFKSSLALYYEKIEVIKENEEENIAMEMGTYLEPFLKGKFEKWFKKNEGIDIKVESVPYILQHPTDLIALANVDGVFLHPVKGDCLVEYKTTSERNYKEWEGDDLPSSYYLQTQWYMYVTNYKYCYLAFLIGNKKFDVKIIERNEEVIKQIAEKAFHFWNIFIINKVPPAPDGTESSKETLEKLYPKETIEKEIIIEEEEYKNYLKDYETLNLKLKEIELGIEKSKQMLKARMGNASIAYCNGNKITWREIFKKEYIVKACHFRQFRISKIKGI
ncbi:MAG: YqaJ viral recombinase family protein [Candidatus Atribacteria bacterium]|nr:YqaJ viral recombinase family protein [Candidatus Atribacteria bacterium]